MADKKLTIKKPQKVEEKTAEPIKQEPVNPPQKTTAELEIPQTKEVTVTPRTAVFQDGIIPSTPGHRIIIANANQFRHEVEHDPPEAKHKAVISPDDNKVLRGN